MSLLTAILLILVLGCIILLKEWLLNFNSSKCKVMHLGRGDPTVYSMTDHTSGEVVELSLVEEEKDLDI